MNKLSLIFLLSLSLLSCKKEDEKPSKRCYKDFSFTTIKGFYCFSESEAEEIRLQKLRGQSTLNLQLATQADYDAAPTKVDGCNTCR